MNKGNYLNILAMLLLLTSAASSSASPSSLSYQGRIASDKDVPLEYNNVSFIFKVTNSAGTCIIYQEQVSGYDMTNSKGIFDVPIGSGSVTYPTDGSLNILDSFNNSRSFTCSGGATYAAASGDSRKLRVMFFDGNGWQTLSPDLVVRSVPYSAFAFSAEKLGTHTSTDFLLKTIMPVANCPANNFLTFDGTNLVCSPAPSGGGGSGSVTSVSSQNSYLTVVNGSAAPELTINVGTSSNTVAAGNDPRFTDARTPTGTAGGDLGGTYPNPSVVKIRGQDVDATIPTAGQFLKFASSKWQATTLAVSDIPGLSATLSSAVMQSQFPASCAASQTLTFSAPSGAFTCSSIAITASQVSGNITGNASGFTGNLAGDVSGTQGATSVDKIKGTVVSATTPLSGQFFKFDGTNWSGNSIGIADIKSSITPFGGAFASAACTAAQTLTYVSASDNFKCVSIAADASQITTGTIAAARLPASASYWASASGGIKYTGGNVGIGTAPGAKFHVLGDAAFENSNNDNSAANFSFWKSRAYGATIVNDNLGYISFYGADGSSSVRSAYVSASVDSAVSGNSVPANIAFGTTTPGATTVTEKMRLASSGNLGIGTTSPSATLDVNGSIKSIATSNASTTIDFSTGNLQYTSSSCGAMVLNNMKSGATYTLAVQGAAGGTCSFTANSGSGTGALTVKTGSISLTQTAAKHTLFTFLVMNGFVYVASIDGY